MTANLPPTGLSFFDGRELDDAIKLAVVDALDHARKWKAIPPPPLFTDEELAGMTPPGEKTWTRDLAKTPPPDPKDFDPAADRYPEGAILNELAMSLYRAACRCGLHTTGTEALLLSTIERLEAELAANAGIDRAPWTSIDPAELGKATHPIEPPIVAEVSVRSLKVKVSSETAGAMAEATRAATRRPGRARPKKPARGAKRRR